MITGLGADERAFSELRFVSPASREEIDIEDEIDVCVLLHALSSDPSLQSS